MDTVSGEVLLPCETIPSSAVCPGDTGSLTQKIRDVGDAAPTAARAAVTVRLHARHIAHDDVRVDGDMNIIGGQWLLVFGYSLIPASKRYAFSHFDEITF
jgi:hypothetical protein